MNETIPVTLERHKSRVMIRVLLDDVSELPSTWRLEHALKPNGPGSERRLLFQAFAPVKTIVDTIVSMEQTKIELDHVWLDVESDAVIPCPTLSLKLFVERLRAEFKDLPKHPKAPELYQPTCELCYDYLTSRLMQKWQLAYDPQHYRWLPIQELMLKRGEEVYHDE